MKEDGKLCLTSVTIILFEKLETDHFVKDQKTQMLSKDHDKTRK